jgi:hypothetical protein
MQKRLNLSLSERERDLADHAIWGLLVGHPFRLKHDRNRQAAVHEIGARMQVRKAEATYLVHFRYVR